MRREPQSARLARRLVLHDKMIMASRQRDTHTSLIRKLRIKIAFLLALRYELFFLTVFGFLLGVVILVV